MNRDDIIRMARETCCGWNYAPLENLERFAELVAAAEREACAKVCDDWPAYDVQELAEAIRARGQK